MGGLLFFMGGPPMKIPSVRYFFHFNALFFQVRVCYIIRFSLHQCPPLLRLFLLSVQVFKMSV